MSVCFNVGGANALPLRAVPFVTGGLIDGSTICAATVSNAEYHPMPELTLYTLTAGKGFCSLGSGTLMRMKLEVDEGRKLGKSTTELRSHIPPGICVLEDEVKQLYQYLFNDFVNSNDRATAAANTWNTSPPMSRAEAAFVNETLEPYAVNVANAGRRKATSEHDKNWQEQANRPACAGAMSLGFGAS